MSNRIAILIPCYNAENFIENFCINLASLIPQFDEIIFYNDGSTDNTLNLLIHSGYRYLNSPINRGPGFARNRLLEATTCSYVHFHDVDDPITNDYLNGVLSYKIPAFTAIFCNADWVDAYTDSIVCKWQYYNKQFELEGPSYFIRNPVGGINGLYSKDALLTIGGFDESLNIWEDTDLNLRLSLTYDNIVFTETALVKSLRYRTSISANNDRIREYKCLFLKKHLSLEDRRIKQELITQINKLFHEAVYEEDWNTYNLSIKLAKHHQLKIPVTSNWGLTIMKNMLGPKYFTQLKQKFLNKFIFK